MPSFSCSTCKFADMAMGATGPVVECHRFPPTGDPGSLTLSVLPDDAPPDLVALHDEAVEAVAEIDFPRWPRVLADDWCGEHQPRSGDSIPVAE